MEHNTLIMITASLGGVIAVLLVLLKHAHSRWSNAAAKWEAAERKARKQAENYRYEVKRSESLISQLNEARSRLAHTKTVAQRKEESAVARRREAVEADIQRGARLSNGRLPGTAPAQSFSTSPTPAPAPDPSLNPALQPMWWPPVPSSHVHAPTPSAAPEPCSSSSWGSSSDSGSSSSSSDSGSSSCSSSD